MCVFFNAEISRTVPLSHVALFLKWRGTVRDGEIRRSVIMSVFCVELSVLLFYLSLGAKHQSVLLWCYSYCKNAQTLCLFQAPRSGLTVIISHRAFVVVLPAYRRYCAQSVLSDLWKLMLGRTSELVARLWHHLKFRSCRGLLGFLTERMNRPSSSLACPSPDHNQISANVCNLRLRWRRKTRISTIFVHKGFIQGR